jgi:hypothetical protein
MATIIRTTIFFPVSGPISGAAANRRIDRRPFASSRRRTDGIVVAMAKCASVIREIQTGLHLSQAEYAAALGVAVETLRTSQSFTDRLLCVTFSQFKMQSDLAS